MFCLQEKNKYHQFLAWVGPAVSTSYEQNWTGSHMLLIATLYDALVILSKPYLKGEENKIRYAETLQWFASNNEEPFSYIWICFHLQLEPSHLREEIRCGALFKKERRRRRAKEKGIN